MLEQKHGDDSQKREDQEPRAALAALGYDPIGKERTGKLSEPYPEGESQQKCQVHLNETSNGACSAGEEQRHFPVAPGKSEDRDRISHAMAK